MNTNRFTLQKYSGKDSRHICPGCNDSQKTFSLYIDTSTGQPIHPTVGRCNRLEKCNYHYPPSQYFENNNLTIDPIAAPPAPRPPREPSFIDAGLFNKTLCHFENNNFVKYLLSIFDEKTVSGLIEKYYIGSSKHWPCSSIFWQIDIKAKIRTGKIMLYDAISGSRIKEPFNHIDWVHKLIKQPDFELKQCLFGEHLLKGNTKPVAIVESEKTAIIASVYLPGFLWLAVGGAEGLNFDKLQVLTSNKVVLFPDLGMFNKWTDKAGDFNKLMGTRWKVDNLLEQIPGLKVGADLADYLVTIDASTFARDTPAPPPPAPETIIFDSPVNWFNGHLLPCMMDYNTVDNLNF